jgi:hypothetical protein
VNKDRISPKQRFLAITLIPALLLLGFTATGSPTQKKKKGGKKAAPESQAPATAPAEASAPATPTTPETKPEATSAPSQAAPAPAAAPPTKTATTRPAPKSPWGLEVAAYAVIGSGRPGKTAADFDKPDGVAFLNNGILLATDAKNRRIQVWDVQAKARLGEFGHGVFGGQVVDIAVTPDNKVLVTDQLLNLAYLFEPPAPGEKNEKGKELGPYDFQFKGTRFGEQSFDKLGGIAVDSKGRIYLVDAHLNEVKRFTPDFKVDPSFHFERARPDGSTYLHGCEGIAFDDAQVNLFVASEKDSIVQVFDLESGAYRKKLVGKLMNADQPAGTSVFAGAIEGLTIVGNYLLAVDESVGQIQMFDLTRPDSFNSDLALLNAHGRKTSGYKGFFGHPPLVDFEDKTNIALQQKVKDGSIIPGQANPPGYFCSPDAIASHKDPASGETYIAIADQCNYRIAVYRWSDLNRAINGSAPAASSQERPAAASTGTGGKKKKGKK